MNIKCWLFSLSELLFHRTMNEFLKHVMSENCQLCFIIKGCFEDLKESMSKEKVAWAKILQLSPPCSSKYVYQEMNPFWKPQVFPVIPVW